jgi:enoyl-CoA hydratase
MSINLTFSGKTATIIMDDGKVNALDNSWFKNVLSALDEVESSEATSLMLKGREGIFSGGLNIKWLPTMTRSERVEFRQLFPGVMMRLYRFPIPTIAVITGHAIAGGCILACACDRRVAISGAKVAMNEVRANMTPPQWAIDIVRDVIPMPLAKLMFKFGEPVSTDQLVDAGVIEGVYDSQEQLTKASLDIVSSFEGISALDFANTKIRVRDALQY